MLDTVLLTAHVEHVGDVLCPGAVGVARREGELDAVVGQDSVDLEQTDELSALINDTPVDLPTRDRLKAVFGSPDDAIDLELGFAMFFLNRTHRSGILNGGVIGEREQTEKWKIDVRYNKGDLIRRLERIATARRRIEFTNVDAVEFVETKSLTWPAKTIVYLDPPYYEKGS